MGTDDEPRRRRRRGEETRTALVQAALQVIERDGISAATTRRIADAAGLPLGAVHYWFADKDDLLRAVVDVLLQEVRADLGNGPAGETAGQRMARVFASYVAMAPGRQLALFEATTHAIRTDGLQELATSQYQAYRAAAREGLEPWLEHADTELPGGSHALATLLVAVVDGLTLADLADPEGSQAGHAFVLFADLLRRAGLH